MEKRNQEVLSTKRETGLQYIQLNQELAEKTEELRILANREEAAVKDAQSYR